MKKKFFIGLFVLLLSFIAGGIYVTASIDAVISKLENIMTLHQVEFLRENLLTRIKIVQTDLLLKDSPHANNIDTFVEHVMNVESAVSKCFECHHDDPMVARLNHLKMDISLYQKKLSRVYTMRANSARIENIKQDAYEFGQDLLEEVNTLVITSAKKINQRIIQVRNGITQTRLMLTVFLILGPLFILAISFYLVKSFAGSIATLMEATEKIKQGDLNFRISKGLKDEFNELAESFNEMAHSLEEQCNIVHSTQQLYRILFESAGDAIFIMEADEEHAGQIVSANQAAADMHGYSVEELLKMKIQDLDTPDAADLVKERIKRIMGGEKIKALVEHRRKDGTIFPVEISAVMLEIDGHKYILAFDRDITERVQSEKALQRSKQLMTFGEMAAGLAHEIKNPLAGIKVSIEVLANELDIGPEDREIFLQMVKEINRIETLLKNLLNYARPPKPHFDLTDVNTLLDNAVKNAQLTLKSPTYAAQSSKDLHFIKELGIALPPVMADSSQLQQIFLNMLLNAEEAIPEQGAITVKSTLDENGNICITFTDTGKGIDEENLKKIFHPFFTTKSKGTGLGLAISKRLIEQHNGTISASNNPGGGATFTITLPVKQNNEGTIE